MSTVERSSHVARAARGMQRAIASPLAPVATLLFVVLGLYILPSLGAPLERVSDLHFLVGVVTLLLVYLVEHNSRRDTTAMHLKLDEIMKALPTRERSGVEELPATEIEAMRERERDTPERA